jgi:hypothetical protein
MSVGTFWGAAFPPRFRRRAPISKMSLTCKAAVTCHALTPKVPHNPQVAMAQTQSSAPALLLFFCACALITTGLARQPTTSGDLSAAQRELLRRLSLSPPTHPGPAAPLSSADINDLIQHFTTSVHSRPWPFHARSQLTHVAPSSRQTWRRGRRPVVRCPRVSLLWSSCPHSWAAASRRSSTMSRPRTHAP